MYIQAKYGLVVLTITQSETDILPMWLSNLNLKCRSYFPT